MAYTKRKSFYANPPTLVHSSCFFTVLSYFTQFEQTKLQQVHTRLYRRMVPEIQYKGSALHKNSYLYTFNTPTRTLSIYDCETMTRNDVILDNSASMPINHKLILTDQGRRIILVGGHQGNYASGEIFEYLRHQHKLVERRGMHYPRTSFGTAIVEDRFIYMAGGMLSQNTPTSSVEYYDPVSQKCYKISASLAEPKVSLTLCYVPETNPNYAPMTDVGMSNCHMAGYLYAFGGYTLVKRIAMGFREVERLSLKDQHRIKKFETISLRLNEMDAFSSQGVIAQHQDHKLLIFGGNRGVNLQAMARNCYEFNLESSEIIKQSAQTMLENSDVFGNSEGVITLGKKCYVLGKNQVHGYSLDEHKWLNTIQG